MWLKTYILSNVFSTYVLTLESGIDGPPRLLIFKRFSNLPSVIPDPPFILFSDIFQAPPLFQPS